MALPDVRITKEAGLNRRTQGEDAISGLVCGGVSVVDGAQLDTTYELRGIKELEDLLIDADYDSTNDILIYHHVDRFFKRCPNGKLYLRLVSQQTGSGGVSMADMVDNSGTHLKQLLIDANGEVRQAGVVLNPDLATYTSTTSNGLDNDVQAAVTAAQALAEAEFDAHRPVVVLIEGREFNGTVGNAEDLRDLASNQVGVVIAADLDISDSDTAYQNYAAVGDVLGMLAKAKVNESLGWVAAFPLTDVPKGIFVRAGLSSGSSINTYAGGWATLHDKGYIFARPHTGLSGFWLNASPTCDLVTDDEAYLENARTLNKAAREIRKALLPELHSPIQLTSEGKIEPVRVASLQAKATSGLQVMQRNLEVSAFTVFIDPDTNFIAANETLEVVFSIVPVGVARQIEGKVKLVASL